MRWRHFDGSSFVAGNHCLFGSVFWQFTALVKPRVVLMGLGTFEMRIGAGEACYFWSQTNYAQNLLRWLSFNVLAFESYERKISLCCLPQKIKRFNILGCDVFLFCGFCTSRLEMPSNSVGTSASLLFRAFLLVLNQLEIKKIMSVQWGTWHPPPWLG